jgi:integrase
MKGVPLGTFAEEYVSMSVEINQKPKKTKQKRRGNGRGTLRQLPSGQWRWEIRLGDARHSGVEANKSLAEAEIARVVTDHKRGVLAVPDKTTLKAFAAAWLDRHSGIRASTREDYAMNLRYAFEILGDIKIKDVRPSHIKDLLNKLAARKMKGGGRKGRPMSRRTVGMVRLRLKSVFDEAVADQIIYSNPVASVKRARTDHDDEEKVGIALTDEQAARFREIGSALHEAGVARLWPALCVAITIGFRRGEVMALRWLDIDFDQKVIRVRQNITEVKGKLQIGKPKTKRSTRDVPLPPGLQAVLEVHKRNQQAEDEMIGYLWKEDSPVFSTFTGAYCAPSNLLKACKNVLEWSHVNPVIRRRDTGNRDAKGKRIWVEVEIGFESRLKGIPVPHRSRLTAIAQGGEKLPNIRVHDLRHTFATIALRSGARIERISKILGHATTSITQDIYQHVSFDDLKEEVFDLFATPILARAVPVVTLN